MMNSSLDVTGVLVTRNDTARRCTNVQPTPGGNPHGVQPDGNVRRTTQGNGNFFQRGVQGKLIRL